MPKWLNQVPASIAHEYAHQVYEILEDEYITEIDKLYKKSVSRPGVMVSDYSSSNAEEFFAENYAYYVRSQIHHNQPYYAGEIIELIKCLSYND